MKLTQEQKEVLQAFSESEAYLVVLGFFEASVKFEEERLLSFGIDASSITELALMKAKLDGARKLLSDLKGLKISLRNKRVAT